MRDIVLYFLAVALVTGSGIVALTAGPDVHRASELLRGQASRDSANGQQLQDWTDKLGR